MVFARVTLTYLSCLLQLHRPLPNTIFLRAKKEKYKKPIGIQCEHTQTLMRNKNTRHGLYCTEFEPVIFTYSISKSKSKHLSLPIEIFQHKNKRFSKLHEKNTQSAPLSYCRQCDKVRLEHNLVIMDIEKLDLILMEYFCCYI